MPLISGFRAWQDWLHSISPIPGYTPFSQEAVDVDFLVLKSVGITIKVVGPNYEGEMDEGDVLTIPNVFTMYGYPTLEELHDIRGGKHNGVRCIKTYHCEQPCRKRCCDLENGYWGPPVDYTAVGKKSYEVEGEIGSPLGNPETGKGFGGDCIINVENLMRLERICDEGLCGEEEAASQGP